MQPINWTLQVQTFHRLRILHVENVDLAIFGGRECKWRKYVDGLDGQEIGSKLLLEIILGLTEEEAATVMPAAVSLAWLDSFVRIGNFALPSSQCIMRLILGTVDVAVRKIRLTADTSVLAALGRSPSKCSVFPVTAGV